MRTDMLLWVVGKAIDTAVDKLVVRGSCSHERWLTFDIEAVSGDGSTFRYLAQYRAMGGYVDYRLVIPGEPHVKLADNASYLNPRAPWVPLATLRTEDYLKGLSRKELRAIAEEKGVKLGLLKGNLRELVDVPYRIHGEHLDIAPGFVITSGSHDSCWRDHALKMQGLPKVDTGRTWKRDNGQEFPIYEDTTYFRWAEAHNFRLYSVKIEGPTGGSWEAPEGGWDHLSDGEWINPDPETLTDAWAVYTALGALYACGGHEGDLELDLDTSYDYYRPYDPSRDGDEADDNRNKLMRTQQRRVHVGYRLGSDGKVTHTGVDTTDVGPSRYEWEEVESRYLDRTWHLRRCGASQKKIDDGLVGISHLWDW